MEAKGTLYEILNFIEEKNPSISNRKWYFSIFIRILFIVVLVFFGLYSTQTCITHGLAEFNKSCEVCINNCVLTQRNETSITTKTFNFGEVVTTTLS